MASHVGKRTRKISVKTCVVCCEEEQFYAIGVCDHWVCYKCCVRMRVLGKENYCSVCRADLNQVFLTRKRVPYAELLSKGTFSYFDKRYGIRYQDRSTEEAVKELLQHCCPICPDRPPERSFNQLRSHVRKAHEMNYCDLCVTHLRKYTYECKVYTRPDLARHRRQGDADDKSYKGHPLCEFCDERYLDDDELHRHLRKSHFWCHFCERDGRQQYYPNYVHLREHFREEHFLCEEGDCIQEKFTSVFCTKVDFQAHIAVKHANKLSKAEARQARQLDVDLQFAPRPRAPFRRNHTSRDADSQPKEQRWVKMKEDKTQNRHEAEGFQEASSISPSDLPSPPSSAPLSLHVDVQEFPPMQSGQISYGYTQQDTVNTSNYAKERKPPDSNRLENPKISVAEDFPSLPAAPSKPNHVRPPPPGFSAAAAKPVGSSQQNKKSKPPGKAKPPDSKSAEPPGLANGRGTGSREENLHPTPNQEGTVNTQVHHGRNQALVETIKALLEHSDAKFIEFKRLSGGFRQGAISANSYYEECFQLFGSKFSQVFFELVDLLPDQVKQQELLKAQQDAKVLAKQEGRIKKNGTSAKREVPVWNSVVKDAAAPPERPIVSASNKPARSNRPSVVSEQEFPSLPAATGKKYVRPLYKASKPAVVLKEAWVRGK